MIRFRFILSALLILVFLSVAAQEIKIKSFSMQMEPMTVPMQRKDNNGNVCALVKVIIPSAQAAFEGSLVGNCDFKTSEYWCYLSPGSKHLKVKYPGCEPLLVNFETFIGSGLKTKQIYELRLDVPSAFHEQNQKIYTLSIVAHSNEMTTLLGKQMYAQMDSVIVKRYNSQGVYINTISYSESTLSVLQGEYIFHVGAVEGDRFEVTAKGYRNSVIDFNNPETTAYYVTLVPLQVNVKYVLKDAQNSETLIGVNVYKNPQSDNRFFSQKWDNLSDSQSRDIKCDECTVTDFNGCTDVFRHVKSTDEFLFTYVGYKDKKIILVNELDEPDNLGIHTCVVELEPYEDGETREIQINIGGMGIDDKGSVTITNTRSNERFTMSQKSRENYKRTNVAIGDELIFTRRGFRTVSVKFKYSIPERINIAPLKGKQSDIQYLVY